MSGIQEYSVGEQVRIYQNTANDVAQMRHVVDVGQSAGDENILFPRLGKNRLSTRAHLELPSCSLLFLSYAVNRGVLSSSNFQLAGPSRYYYWGRWGESWQESRYRLNPGVLFNGQNAPAFNTQFEGYRASTVIHRSAYPGVLQYNSI